MPVSFSRVSRVRLSLVALAVVVVAGCSHDNVPPPKSDADYQVAYGKFLQKRQHSLVTAGKPISFTGLKWLKQGVTTIGSDTTNMVVLTGRDVPAKVGTLTRTGVDVKFEPAPGVNAMIDSAPAVARDLVNDAVGPGSRVDVGRAGFRIVKRVDSIGVRMWDGDRANSSGIEPLEYFPVDQAWRLGAKFTRRAKPDTIAAPTSSGVAEEHIDVGTLDVNVDGKPYALTAFEGDSATDLFVTFSDVTSGDETYGFRFFHALLDTATNVAVIDFNMAYNPDCAFSAYTTCPLPPASNRLQTRVSAGEKIVKHKAPAATP